LILEILNGREGMTTKADYSFEEWTGIRRGTILAGMTIINCEPTNPGEVERELLWIGKALSQPVSITLRTGLIETLTEEIQADPSLAPALVGAVTSANTEEERLAAYRAALEGVQAAVGIVARKSPAEDQQFRQYLYSIAHFVAEAHREGSFLGFGGKVISDNEKAALKELSEMLDLGV
jgi:hypothetical protein